MSDENPNVPSEPSSDLNVKLPDSTIPEIVEPFPASPLDHPISPIPSENISPVPPPPVIPNMPPPPPNSSSMPPPPPTGSYTPRQTYSNNPPQYSQNYPHAQYQPGTTSNKRSNKFWTGCCIGCAVVLVIAIIGIAVSMKTCSGMFGGIGSMVGDAIAMKTMSKSDVESKADTSFTLDQFAQSPQDWQGKYVVFETTADMVDTSNPDSQTITVKSPMVIIMNLTPNFEVKANMPIRVWGKVSKFDLSMLTKYAPDMPKDAAVTGFVVACAVEPSDGNSVPENTDNNNPDGVDNGGKPPAEGESIPPENGESTPPDGSEGTEEETPQK